MMRKNRNDNLKENTTGKKRLTFAGKAAILCTVVMLAAGGAYTWHIHTTNVPELTTFVDHEGETVIIGGEEVPLGGEPKVTTDTKTKKKTVMLKKPSKKTRTKKSTKTKNSTDTQKNGSNVVVTETTVVTVKRQKFKKNSRKKVIITKITTTKKVSVQAAGNVQTQSASQNSADAGATTADIKTLAPKLNGTLMNVYTTLGFTVTIDPTVSYSGYFNARNQSIILRKSGDTIYHEMGHFLAFVAGNVDKRSDFASIYNEEKGKYAGTNTNYVTQNASEYFAESFKDYTLNASALQKSRPKTYQAIVSALSNVTSQQINKLKLAYGPIWNQN